MVWLIRLNMDRLAAPFDNFCNIIENYERKSFDFIRSSCARAKIVRFSFSYAIQTILISIKKIDKLSHTVVECEKRKKGGL